MTISVNFVLIELVLCTYIWSKKATGCITIYNIDFELYVLIYKKYMLCMVMHPVAFLTRYMYIVLIQLIQNSPKSSERFSVIWLLNSVERKKNYQKLLEKHAFDLIFHLVYKFLSYCCVKPLKICAQIIILRILEMFAP